MTKAFYEIQLTTNVDLSQKNWRYIIAFYSNYMPGDHIQTCLQPHLRIQQHSTTYGDKCSKELCFHLLMLVNTNNVADRQTLLRRWHVKYHLAEYWHQQSKEVVQFAWKYFINILFIIHIMFHYLIHSSNLYLSWSTNWNKGCLKNTIFPSFIDLGPQD